ncbi:MerR family DNA-binding transcriptional regulator [Kribbella sp. CWNU-51]
MVNIGEFARLGGVSTRMLRHYDAIGVLKPADVDPSGGDARTTWSDVGHRRGVPDPRASRRELGHPTGTSDTA